MPTFVDDLAAHHALPEHQVVLLLETDPETGLTDQQARLRREQMGANVLPPPRRRGPLVRLLRHFHHPLVYVLLVAMALSAVLGEWVETAVIAGVVLVNVVVGFLQEERAEKYARYVRSVAECPAFVGCHWFQYIDEPITGRWFDGENYNIGFVTVVDSPYPELVAAAKRIHANVYRIRHRGPSGLAARIIGSKWRNENLTLWFKAGGVLVINDAVYGHWSGKGPYITAGAPGMSITLSADGANLVGNGQTWVRIE